MKIAIFDLDGTLADSMFLWRNLGEIYLEEKGLQAPRDLSRILRGLSLEEGMFYLKEQAGLEQPVEEISQEINQMIETYYDEKIKIKAGVKDYLKSLNKAGVRLILATASYEDLARKFLERYEIDGYFEAIETPRSLGFSKREPEFFHALLEKLELKDQDVWVFEDAPHAIKAAKNAGLRVLAISDANWEDQAEEIKKLANIYIESFEEMDQYRLW